MNRYQIVKQLGDGTYGSVLLANSVDSGEKVAIKKMKKKYYSWDECLSLREVKSLRKLSHPNIVKLKEVIRENDQLYFVFEFMKENLYQMMKDRDRLFPESMIRNIVYQVFQGLAFMHKHGFFHRDLKPENLLCSGPDCVKIADFGLAREVRSRPPYTDYVSTRWYRAPEVLLRSTNYNSPIDIWALGCIMAEVYTLRPLFPGSSEIDEIFKVCTILGTPKMEEWEEGYRLAAVMNFRWPQAVATNLKTIIPNGSNEAIQLLRDMLLWNPHKRPSASQCLRYPYFQVGQNFGSQLSRPPINTNPTTPPSNPEMHQAKPAHQYQPLQENKGQNTNRPQFADNKGHIVNRPQLPENKVDSHPVAAPRANPAPKQFEQPDAGFAVSVTRKASGRKRWGPGLSDTWDDWDDLDWAAPSSNKKISTKPLPSIKQKPERPNKENFDDDDDFLGSLVKKSPNKSNHRLQSGRSSASSAKQHYIGKARYLPGINPRNSAKKDGRGWGGDLGMGKITGGLGLGRQHNNPLGGPGYSSGTSGNTGGNSYVPSFMSQTPAKPSTYPSVSWKRVQPSPMTGLNKNSASYRPMGRTDWAAKYLKS